MKTQIKNHSNFALVTLLALAGCTKGNDVVTPPTPTPTVTITSFTPTMGKATTVVSIIGTGFSATASANTVSFNGINATVTAATNTQLTVVAPVGVTTGRISVTNAGSTAISIADFTLEPQLYIASFAPATGYVGSDVIITGALFSATPSADSVFFNGKLATVTSASTTQLNVVVPAGATTGKITVKVGGVATTSATDFTMAPTTGLVLMKSVTRVAGDYTFISTFDYDANNKLKLITETQVYPTYTIVFTQAFLRDAQGRIMQAKSGDNYMHSYAYDANGKLATDVYLTSAAQFLSQTNYAYFTDRYEQSISSQGSVARKTVFYYTADGKNINTVQAFDSTGKLTYTATLKYDTQKSFLQLIGFNTISQFLTSGPQSVEFFNGGNETAVTNGYGVFNTTSIYTYNADGYPITRADIRSSAPTSQFTTYQYIYK